MPRNSRWRRIEYLFARRRATRPAVVCQRSRQATIRLREPGGEISEREPNPYTSDSLPGPDAEECRPGSAGYRVPPAPGTFYGQQLRPRIGSGEPGKISNRMGAGRQRSAASPVNRGSLRGSNGGRGSRFGRGGCRFHATPPGVGGVR